jgi:hypothetical protein
MVLNEVGRYESLVGQISYIEAADRGKPGRPPAGALTLYRQATDLLRTGILPAASNLTTANAAALDSTYDARHSLADWGAGLVLIIGLALIALLAGTQVFISATHRRTLNPALAAATLLATILTAVGAISLGAQADEYQRAFEAESQELVKLKTPGIFGYDAALAKAITAYRANEASLEFHGYFGVEFRNITFPGERAAGGVTCPARSPSIPASPPATRTGPSTATTTRSSRSSASTSAGSPRPSPRARAVPPAGTA